MNELIEQISESTRLKRDKIALQLRKNLEVDVLMVSGSTGWFGRSTLDLIDPTLIPTLITKSSRSTSIFHFGSLSSVEDASFFPDFVDCYIDFAFQTRDKLLLPHSDDGNGSGNFELVDSSMSRLRQGQIGRYLGFSSGAALDSKKDAYSQEKLYLEQAFSEFRNPSDSLVRVWSTSGSHCNKPDVFAFANLVQQARNGDRIFVSSASPVYRRYCAIEEVMAVITSPIAPPIFDSGGELVELGELAESVSRVLNPGAEIIRPEMDGVASSYHSASRTFEELLFRVGMEPMSIEEQILNSLVGLES